jgi:plastocyanin domain-containing protein
MTRPIHFTLPALLALGTALPALADGGEHVLVIQDHRFEPSEIRVPARERVKLVVDNRDPTPEEFESSDLRREKIVPGNSKATIWVGPLPKGEYQFYGEFHESTAQGKLIAE